MPYPRKLLGEGEEVVLDFHPHWFYLWRPVAWTAFWLIAPAAVLVLAGTQAAIVKRDGLKRLGRRLAAAVGRRLTARRSA